MHKARSQQQLGFTIVELLVVIVVIGVLAAIALVSYSGISQRATAASLQSDLSNAANQLKMFYAENGVYPASISTDCVAQPDSTTNKCITVSPGSSYTTYPYVSTGSGFVLTETNGTLVYRVTENSAPGLVAPLTAIAATTGTAQSGSTLSAGSITPAGATGSVSYQWRSASSANGTYTNIANATNSTYAVVDGDVGRYIEVVATGMNTYYGSVSSAPTTVVLANPWLNGLAATVLAGKYVRSGDLGSTYQYKTSNTAVASPQGSTGLDPSYPGNMSLVSPLTNPGVDFSAYPAQDACKAVGGRLPNMQELTAIRAGLASYGNNFASGVYASATEYDSVWSYLLGFPSGGAYASSGKSNYSHVRCVRD